MSQPQYLIDAIRPRVSPNENKTYPINFEFDIASKDIDIIMEPDNAKNIPR